MTQPDQSKLFQLAMEQLIEHGPEAFRDVMSALMNEAMRIEREQFLGARQHERTDSRLGYANGFKPKLLDSQLGTLHLRVPKTRDHGDTPFYPQSLEQDREAADTNLASLAARYEKKGPKLASWLLDNVPEGLSVLALPSAHQRKMRTTNGIERPIQQEIKRRTQLVRVFPNEAALLRLVSAILIEIDDDWTSADKRYIVWNHNDDSD